MLALAIWVSTPNPAAAADSAVILIYHRFGETSFPSTNIRLDQLEAHIAELTSGPYTVLPVPEIVSAIREGRPLPDRTVGITIDDGYKSIYTEAFPRFQAAGLPFTVFVSTDPIDRRFAGFVTWDEIREMRDAGVTIGAHTATHLHMPANSMARNREDMLNANARLQKSWATSRRSSPIPSGKPAQKYRAWSANWGMGQRSVSIPVPWMPLPIRSTCRVSHSTKPSGIWTGSSW